MLASRSGLAVQLCYSLLDRAAAADPDGRQRWHRVNYRGRPVSLLGGVATALGALAVTATARDIPSRVRTAALVAGGGAAIGGVIDDLRGDASARGLRGHLGALAKGEVTTGSLKIACVGGAGLAAGWLAGSGGWARRLAAGITVAAAANLANLLDLRPGRAAKVVALATAPLALSDGRGAAVATVTAGAAAGVLPLDLAETVMLGDVGANTLGALVGVSLVAGSTDRRLRASLAALLALTAASEFVSFSQIIDRVPALRRLDRWGRRADGCRADG